MSDLDRIKKPVADELVRYEEHICKSLLSGYGITRDMLDYIFDNRGKAIRPLIVLLSAAMFNHGKRLPDKSLTGAMLVEMMHTASLVHDDVIDGSGMRRGKPSVKAMWDSRRAVLIGDYILAKSYAAGIKGKTYDILGYLIGSMADLCEGELLQSDQSDKLTMTRDIYYEIIFKKTASLFGTCSGIGALSAGASEDDVVNMRRFGENLGMAFQIKDDILDYAAAVETGKPAYSDLREKKITLPLLAVIEKSGEAEKAKIIGLLSDIRDNPGNAEIIHDIVTEGDGLRIASEVKTGYVDKARKILEPYPGSVYRESLESLCDFMVK